MAVHASHILPWPVYNARFSLLMTFFDAGGDPTDPVTPDTEISKDNAAYVDTAEEVVVASGGRGTGLITLSGAEMACSTIGLWGGAASGPTAPLYTLYPRRFPTLESGTATAGGATTLTLAAGAPAYDLRGAFLRTTGGTGGGGAGGLNNQARLVAAYDPVTKQATVDPAWEVATAAGTTYDILLTEMACNALMGRFLRPLVDGRTANVSAAGNSGVNWASVENPTAAVALTGSTIGLVADALNAATLAASALAEMKTLLTDALAVDTYPEIGQESPPAITTIAYMLRLMYKFSRNPSVHSDTGITVLNDAGTVVDQKLTHSHTTTYSRGKVVTGP